MVLQNINDEWGLVEIADHKGKAVLQLKNYNGETALHVAARRNQLGAATFLVDQGANSKARDKEGKTSALTTAAYGRVRLLGYLLSKHTNLKVTTPEGKTLMHVAVTASYGKPIDMVAFLTKCGMSVNVQDNSLCTPLHDALRANVSQEIISCLQRLGAGLDAKDKDGITPRSLL